MIISMICYTILRIKNKEVDVFNWAVVGAFELIFWALIVPWTTISLY